MARYEVPPYLAIDVGRVAEKLSGCIAEYVEKAGVKGVVVGISGGVDSSTAAALAVRALGRNRVYGLIMPEKETNPKDLEDARRVAKHLGIRWREIDITGIVGSVLAAAGDDYDTAPRVAKGNVKARARMVLLYYHANKDNLLVLGTGDRSEILLGYFTKWGDGAVDLLPLGGLYKTQVRLLAEHLGVPEDIAWKPSSPGLWPGHRASQELGADYDVIDRILYHMVDLGLGDEEVAEKADAPVELVRAVRERIRATRHKRNPPQPCMP